MKIILLFIVSLAIFLPLSALATCTTNTPNNNQVLLHVLDRDGNPLNTSNRYFIIPGYYTMEGGGARLADLGDQQQNTCPTAVVQSKDVMDDGIAVYFKPKNPKFKDIAENIPLNIKFSLDYPNPPCNDLLVWKVDNPPTLPLPSHTISTGAKPNDVYSWFRIQPTYNNRYKLVFCPIEEYCCDIGIFPQGGYKRLAVLKDPWVVQFKLHPPIGKAEAY